MPSFFTKSKEIIEALETNEKNRLIAVLLSLKGDDLKEFKVQKPHRNSPDFSRSNLLLTREQIDWSSAGARYGTTSESMRVNSRKVIAKVKVDEEVEGAVGESSADAKAGNDDAVEGSEGAEKAEKTEKTAEATKGKKAAAPKKPRASKSKAAEGEDGEDKAAAAPKKPRAPKRKADDAEGVEGKAAAPKKPRSPRKKKDPKNPEQTDGKTDGKTNLKSEEANDEEAIKADSELISADRSTEY